MTIIFSDGFESNNYNAWTGVANQFMSNPAVTDTQSKSGVYSSFLQYDNTPYHGGWAYKNISGSLLYARCYVYFDTLPLNNTAMFFMWLQSSGDTQFDREMAGLYNDAGTYKWFVRTNVGGSYNYYVSSGVTVATGTWYYFEFARFINGGAGWTKIWAINNAENSPDIAVTSLTNNDLGDLAVVKVGVGSQDACGTVGVYVDDVVVADAYIGPEVSGTTPKIYGDGLFYVYY